MLVQSHTEENAEAVVGGVDELFGEGASKGEGGREDGVEVLGEGVEGYIREKGCEE